MKEKHDMIPFYAFGRIIKRPRGYFRCKKCGLVIHEDGHIIERGDGSCE